MKTLILITIFACLSFAVFAQNDDVWTKDAKTQLANECIAALNAKYPNLSDDQKDNIAICYANAIQAAHPKRSEWVNMMDIEVKKEKSNTLDQCYKSSGGGGTPKAADPKAPDLKELLVAAWKAGDEEFTFAKSGTSLYQKGNKSCEGTWALEGNTLTITPTGSKVGGFFEGCDKKMVIEVITYTADDLTVTEKEGEKKSKSIHFTKKK